MNKEEWLSPYLQEADRLVDKLGLEIDEKIKKPVAILRMMGFNTSGSCEGHTDFYIEGYEKWGRYDEDRICYPWIDIDLVEKVKDQLDKMSSFVQKYNDCRIVIESLNEYGFTLRTKCSSLEEGQKVMRDFTEWLLNNE